MVTSLDGDMKVKFFIGLYNPLGILNSSISFIQDTPLVLILCAIESSFSNNITLPPARAGAYADDKPAGPPPTTVCRISAIMKFHPKRIYVHLYFPVCFIDK